MYLRAKFENKEDESSKKPFVQLLWKNKDHCKVRILETAIFGDTGKLIKWFFNNKKLAVLKKHAHNTSVFTLEHTFITNSQNGILDVIIF